MENTLVKPKAVTKKTKVTLTYRQFMRIVNYYAVSLCGITVSHISDWNWSDEFCEDDTTLENHINYAEEAFSTFLLDVEPTHYNEVASEIEKLSEKLLMSKDLRSKIVA